MHVLPLRIDEASLVGRWIATPRGIVGDETCARIEMLIQNVFEHVADHPEHGAWQTLFRDPRDGRFWERLFPDGHLQGGGPPAIRNVTEPEGRSKYLRR